MNNDVSEQSNKHSPIEKYAAQMVFRLPIQCDQRRDPDWEQPHIKNSGDRNTMPISFPIHRAKL